MKRSRHAAKLPRKASHDPNSPSAATDGDAIAKLIASLQRGKLVAIIGTGVSIALTDAKFPILSWVGLIQAGFSHGVKKGVITPAQETAWKSQIDSRDIDDLLSAAEFMGRKLGAPSGELYSRWLKNSFSPVQPTNDEMINAIRVLIRAGIPICTLNYDSLLERVTGLPPINLTETGKVTGWMHRESPGILHLHGSWEVSSTCILGIRDYEGTVSDEIRDLIQRSLASFSRLLFIGCGDTFADPNFSALITWLRATMKTSVPEHYALVRESELVVRHADPAWRGFVEPLSYGRAHSDLPTFLVKHFANVGADAVPDSGPTVRTHGLPPSHAKLIQDYRSFLLKDCGQMTIEGVRADMDTAQRRFDLEKLFVPLKVLACPPDIPTNDPQRDNKLLEWQRKNTQSRQFGEVFAKHKGLALLALPGGGKTLLLKRLAVAYADPARRRASTDALPDLDLTPVLIRCREWREHIHRPILALLQTMSNITGQPLLAGLSDALLPLFKEGRVLLLVDGLDEIHDDAVRCTFVEHLESFLEENSLTRLVVTSREAGFNLVAPSLARFCARWRVAPLEDDAITTLCEYWHRLMVGESPQAKVEGHELAQRLLQNPSLKRLAENPLLLTMLLVVKHGAGRLPPDRVSLYSRAVEVLLDTWNIKGHDPLNPKEAVPQLAYVAFQLMRAGKQTATQEELLKLLEEARESVPQIRRYAKDTPYEFLKRVELRSSLLVEAGHQMEKGHTVPFFQFRHLTFQEYLAAVAAAEGHYMEYQKGDTVLTPLKPSLFAEEWKEVVPMAAVLARKQAEPLIAALVVEGTRFRRELETREATPEPSVRRASDVPPPVARIVQCLVEEAEAAPETLIAALQLTVLFGGDTAEMVWQTLSRGPYAEELLHQAWLLYSPMRWPAESNLFITVASLQLLSKPQVYWISNEGQAELKSLLTSAKSDDVAKGLLTFLGWCWQRTNFEMKLDQLGAYLPIVEQHLFRDDPALWAAASWGWAFVYHLSAQPAPSVAVLDRLLALWLGDGHQAAKDKAALALSTQMGLTRNKWNPVLTDAQIHQVLKSATERAMVDSGPTAAAALVVGFHAKNVFSEEDLASQLMTIRGMIMIGRKRRNPAEVMLEQMGQVGRKHLVSKVAGRKAKT